MLRLLATRPFSTATSESIETSLLEPSDLDHVHILRPPRPQSNVSGALPTYLSAIEEYMLYAPHKSQEREWWGTIVIGGSNTAPLTNITGHAATASNSATATAAATQVAVTAGWQGWLRVDRAEVPAPTGTGTPMGMGSGSSWTFWNKNAEEARREREEREKAVEEVGWVAASAWGTFVFGSGKT